LPRLWRGLPRKAGTRRTKDKRFIFFSSSFVSLADPSIGSGRLGVFVANSLG